MKIRRKLVYRDELTGNNYNSISDLHVPYKIDNKGQLIEGEHEDFYIIFVGRC